MPRSGGMHWKSTVENGPRWIFGQLTPSDRGQLDLASAQTDTA